MLTCFGLSDERQFTVKYLHAACLYEQKNIFGALQIYYELFREAEIKLAEQRRASRTNLTISSFGRKDSEQKSDVGTV